MKNCLLAVAVTISIGSALPNATAQTPESVRMGCGLMTFDTVPGWGLGEDGKSVIGPTHGGVVVDKAGNVYTSANIGVFVFSPDGKVIRGFVGDEYSKIHVMEMRD
ncbi:MAG: 6-bladed beta-propeller, partial [Fuerstiella sp.]